MSPQFMVRSISSVKNGPRKLSLINVFLIEFKQERPGDDKFFLQRFTDNRCIAAFHTLRLITRASRRVARSDTLHLISEEI